MSINLGSARGKSYFGAWLFFPLLVHLPASAAEADTPSHFTFNVLADVRYEDNIGFAPDSASERDELTTHVAAGLTWKPVETAQSEFSMSISPYYNGVKDLTDLSHYGVELGASFRQQFSADFTAVFVELNVLGTSLKYENSEPRDGYEFEADLAFGKRFSPKFGARLGLKYYFRESTDDNPEGTVLGVNSADVYDLERTGAFIKFAFDPTVKTSLFFEYNYMDGEAAATGSLNGFNNPDAFDSFRDFAFDEGLQFLAWRVEVEQNVYSVGLTQAFTDKLVGELTASYLDVSGEFGNDYENTVVTAGVRWTF